MTGWIIAVLTGTTLTGFGLALWHYRAARQARSQAKFWEGWWRDTIVAKGAAERQLTIVRNSALAYPDPYVAALDEARKL